MSGIFRGVGNRGGVRGGKDQFNWDEVRGDKYKEYYLGQATKIQGYNWWNRGQSLQHALDGRKESKTAMAAREQELQRIKTQEQEMMMEALGLKPKKHREQGRALEKHEFRDLIKKGSLAAERDDYDVANRVGGLGFEPAPKVSSEGIEMPLGVYTPRFPGQEAEVPNQSTSDSLQPIESPTTIPPRVPRTVERPIIEKKEKKEKKHKKEKKDKKSKKEKRKLEESSSSLSNKSYDRDGHRDRDSSNRNEKESSSRSERDLNRNDRDSSYRSERESHHREPSSRSERDRNSDRDRNHDRESSSRNDRDSHNRESSNRESSSRSERDRNSDRSYDRDSSYRNDKDSGDRSKRHKRD